MSGMKTTGDLFSLSEGSIVSSMFATRFFAAYLSGAFTMKNLVVAVLGSLRFTGIVWLIVLVYLATLHPSDWLQKAVRWSALGIFALQGILYVLVFYALYAAYNAGSGSEAAMLLSTLGFVMIACSWVEAFLATSVALGSLFQLFHKENS
ncbi:MAG: hypothetical protein E4G74_02985 [Erysipelotrichales bacterium]|nr:MAG: hypothetical protein E4G74_02985 [Erysipelotrichales bacterium]